MPPVGMFPTVRSKPNPAPATNEDVRKPVTGSFNCVARILAFDAGSPSNALLPVSLLICGEIS